MKVCLNAWQDKEQIEKADELKVVWSKREIIPEIFEQYPADKTVVLECFAAELDDATWADLKMYNGLGKGKFKICCADWKMFKDSGIPFYVGYPVTDLYTIVGLVKAGVTDVRVAGPLIFDLASVRKCLEDTSVKIRVSPNVAYTDGLPRPDGVLGGWIRPEDMHLYENLIDIIEFEDIPNKAREQVLYRLYMEDHEWLGSLQDLITNLNFSGLNRMIPTTMSSLRVNCKQACLTNSHCRICYRMLKMADPKLYDYLLEKEPKDEQ